ncbi:MAG: hypothetical protein JSU72_02345 [Deltaproteobacteria bacterium]|nr:MAG: hypothetical protein JSU72_02345 [Deltaproteobacteria bacterium]
MQGDNEGRRTESGSQALQSPRPDREDDDSDKHHTKKSALRIGWVIGKTNPKEGAGSVSILHTRNGGRRWTEQLDRSEWAGYKGNDISAVDRRTAWAALNSPDGDGVILHTTNGGSTWTAQELPDGVDTIKNIKGLSRREAWAVSLGVKILHTADGGETWNIVEHPFELIDTANRMDVIGCVDPCNAFRPGKNKLMSNANIWIAYEEDKEGNNLGMIHSLYNGELWRKESVDHTPGWQDYNGMHMVSAYSPRVVWAAARRDSTLFRTLDGGESWGEVASVHGEPNDIDNMCAPGSDTVWAVQNQDISAGVIYHVRVFDAGEPEIRPFDPAKDFDPTLSCRYEGLTCVDDQTALAVGSCPLKPTGVIGVIVSTTDGDGVGW